MNINNNERDDKPVESKEKEVPSAIGNKVTTKNHNVIILRDSMVKNLQGWRMKTSMKSNEKVIVKSFPGTSTDDMSFHAVPSMKENRDALCCIKEPMTSEMKKMTMKLRKQSLV